MAETVKGLAAYLRRLASVPAAVQVAVKAQLHAEATEMVAAMKRAAPVEHGDLRDSIRWQPHPDRELSVQVIADVKDSRGKGGYSYAGNVEHGHKAKDGTLVAARPFFFPTYRARKKPMRRRLAAAARKAIKAL